MEPCEYCDKEAVTTRRIYDSDMGCSMEVKVCESCANYLDDDRQFGDDFPEQGE